jgi:histone-lysine N-methyltransferase SETMAR
METLSMQDFRVLYLYEFKLGHNAAEAARNINSAFGVKERTKRTVRVWFKKFSSGDFSLQNEERGRPLTKIPENDLKVAVENDPRTTVRQLAATFNVSNQTISKHLNTIGKKKKLDKWVPHDLTEDQKLRRMEACIQHLQKNKIEPFINRIITCDEKWILYDNRKRSAQWLNADERPKHHPK